MANASIITETLTNVPGFTPPNFGAVDFGVPANGIYSAGYKMIAFEPGKILQAQELNEIQFRMNVEQTLTNQMISNWLNEILMYGSSSTTGPGWDGATPLHPDLLQYKISTNALLFNNTEFSDVTGNSTNNTPLKPWFLCKANSFGLYFWLILATDQQLQIPLTDIQENYFIGFTLNTTANATYTGEVATCDTVGLAGNHPLNVRNTSSCGSGRYYIKITGITTSDTQITNDFVAIAQKRSDGLYYLNNIKVKEITG
jgi:hypothetical protein